MRSVALTIISILIMTGSNLAQPSFYLDSSSFLTTEKTDIRCIENREYSHGGLKCYGCYTADNELKYQLSGEFYVAKALIAEDYYRPYIKQGEKGVYLLGCYKDSMPFDGFFRTNDETADEWLFCDFYQNGIRTEQLAHNFFKAITEQHQDNEVGWYTLNQKSIYKNQLVESGIKLSGFQSDDGLTIQVVENIQNSITQDYAVGLFAMHYGELILIKETEKGCYQLQCLGNNPTVNICYTNNRKTYRFTPKNSSKETTEITFCQQKLAGFDISKLKEGEVARYFEKNGELYAEQLQHGAIASLNEWKDADTSKALIMLVEHFGLHPPTLSAEYIADIFMQDKHSRALGLGYIARANGSYVGLKYKAGKENNTYTIAVFEEGNELVIGVDKTLDEIPDILNSYVMQQYKTQAIHE